MYELLDPKPCLCVEHGGTCVDHGVDTPVGRRLREAVGGTWKMPENKPAATKPEHPPETDLLAARIKRLVKKGASHSQVASKLNLTKSQVDHICRNNNIKSAWKPKLRDHEPLMRELHAKGMIDQEIVNELAKHGVSVDRKAIAFWRKKHGLVAHGLSREKQRSPMDAHADLIRRLFYAGCLDREIAEELTKLGVKTSKAGLCGWRTRHGLKRMRAS